MQQLLKERKEGINSQISLPDPPQIGDVWLFANCDDEYGLAGYPGRIPGQIMENLIRWVSENQVIVSLGFIR